jgi:hypothetical protein
VATEEVLSVARTQLRSIGVLPMLPGGWLSHLLPIKCAKELSSRLPMVLVSLNHSQSMFTPMVQSFLNSQIMTSRTSLKTTLTYVLEFSSETSTSGDPSTRRLHMEDISVDLIQISHGKHLRSLIGRHGKLSSNQSE